MDFKLDRMRDILCSYFNQEEFEAKKFLKSILLANFLRQEKNYNSVNQKTKDLTKLFFDDSINNLVNNIDKISTNIIHDEFLKKGETISLMEAKIKYLTLEIFHDYPQAVLQAMKYYCEDLNEYFLYAEYEESKLTQTLQDGLLNLIYNLLEIQDTDSVADFLSGTGKLGKYFLKKKPFIDLCSFESSEYNRMISYLRRKNIGCSYLCHPTSILSKHNDGRKFNKIFMPVIFEEDNKLLPYEKKQYCVEYINCFKSYSVEWTYCLRMIDMLKPQGIAVALISNNALIKPADKEIRKELIRNGFIKSVVALPDRLFKSTAVGASLVVFSKGNKSCRMFDATTMFTKKMKQNELESNFGDAVCDLIKKGGEQFKEVDYSEINKDDYSLYPVRYIENNVYEGNWVYLRDLLTCEISRGVNIPAKELELPVTDSNYRYLSFANIKEGYIDKDLQTIIKPSKQEEKILKNGDIVFTKIGNPIKIAVFEQDEDDDRMVVISDNMYKLTINKEKINPYYLKAFFESEQGKREIRIASSGAALNIISKSKIENIRVLMLPREKQEEIAENYKYLKEELERAQKKIENIQERLNNVWRV